MDRVGRELMIPSVSRGGPAFADDEPLLPCLVDGDDSTFDAGTGAWIGGAISGAPAILSNESGGLRVTRPASSAYFADLVIAPEPGAQYRASVDFLQIEEFEGALVQIMEGTAGGSANEIAVSDAQFVPGTVALDWTAPATPIGDVILRIVGFTTCPSILVDNVTCCPL